MKRKNRGLTFFVIAAICFVLAFGLCGYNFYENYRAEQLSQVALKAIHQVVSQNELAAGELPDYKLYPNMEMPTVTVDGLEYIGVLSIPSRNLELPVVSEWSYPNLKKAPCRYKGSAYTNNLILAAHNYSSHFGDLKNLAIGEQVVFTDVDGNRFPYGVVEQEVLQPTAIEQMQSGEWDLTLFTCTLGGSYRVTVRLELQS